MMKSEHPFTGRLTRRILPALLLGLAFTGCGGGEGAQLSGPVTVFLSDPPVCQPPNGPFLSTWVTITRVRAHLSSQAGGSTPGWVDLLDLRSNPRQVDLLNLGSPNCLLTMLGSRTGLPVGTYQQIRIHLLSNDPGPGEATPSPNQCAGTGGYNCVVTQSGGPELLLLSSQDQNGLKIPPGQIAGGGITLLPGQAADITIDFDACRSIVQQGNGAYRLKPTLHAGEISLDTLGITGRVVDSQTGLPIPGATVLVLAEQPDSQGIDRVISQTLAHPMDGTFNLCPLPLGSYDLVAGAVGPLGEAYAATVTLGVPVGTALGDIPVVPEMGTVTSPATLTGALSSSAPGGLATASDFEISALQMATPPGGSPLLVTVPLFPGSTPSLSTMPLMNCPAGTSCTTYVLVVPPLNPSVGNHASGGALYLAPASGPVPYSVHARALIPGSGGLPNCVPSELTVSLDAMGLPLVVSPGAAVTAAPLDFVDCDPNH